MLKLNAGLSRKVGEPDYGSRGASVNLELEVEGNLISEPDALMDRIRKLFILARQAVDEELNGRKNTSSNSHSTSSGNGNGNGRSAGRSATASQLRAIRSICEEQKINADGLVKEKFGGALEQLSLRDASTLIDELKGKSAGRSR